jgi:hypothetical protein
MFEFVEIFECENRLPAIKDEGEIVVGSLVIFTKVEGEIVVGRLVIFTNIYTSVYLAFKGSVLREKRGVRKMANARAGILKLLRSQESIPRNRFCQPICTTTLFLLGS